MFYTSTLRVEIEWASVVVLCVFSLVFCLSWCHFRTHIADAQSHLWCEKIVIHRVTVLSLFFLFLVLLWTIFPENSTVCKQGLGDVRG